MSELDPQIHINPDNRAVYATDDLFRLTDFDIRASLGSMGRTYEEDPEAYVDYLDASLRQTTKEPRVPYALFTDGKVDPRDGITIVVASLSDGPPQSTAQAFKDYLANPNATISDREIAQPNSWRPVIKAAAMHEALVLSGYNRPLALIFSPPPDEAYEGDDITALNAGITSPYGNIVQRVLSDIEVELLRGDRNHTDRFADIQLYSAGMGHLALGAAHKLQAQCGRDVSGLTLTNLIAGVPYGRRFPRYNITEHYRSAPTQSRSELVIPESTIAVDADKKRSERAMRLRQFAALFNFKHLAAMSKAHSDWVGEAAEQLVANGTALNMPTSYNARITSETYRYMPQPNQHNVQAVDIVSGKAGQKAGLLVGEHVNLGAILAVSGAKQVAKLRA